MPKTLLKISLIKDKIINGEFNAGSKTEKECTAAGIITFMDKDPEFAKVLLEHVAVYMMHKAESREAIRKGEKLAGFKLKN